MCGDYKATVNKALQPNAYPVPVVQHLLHQLGRGKVFAKLDLAQAYQQLPVDEATAEAQTIVTHRGAFKCKRLQFGISTAPGIFQSIMERLLHGLQGVVPYFDDVLIAAEDLTQLKMRLQAVLSRFKEAGLKVKRDKCILAATEVEFLGYKVDSNGLKPTESKLKAIREAPTPKNKTELQAFLGLLNFYNVFLPQKATVAEPLHKLLDKKACWTWGKKEETAFLKVKQLLTSKRVLTQYSPNLPICLTCDASPFGVGAILSHTMPDGSEAPIAFYSRTLAKAERNYSQLEKEALAAVAGIKRFHEYLYGRHFELVTDHQPLLGIIAGNRPTPAIISPRMLRWAEFLAAYSYSLRHRPGKQISHADALSRCPLPTEVKDPATEVFTLTIDSFAGALVTSADVAAASAKDKRLARILNLTLRGWPADITEPELKPFQRRQAELSVCRGCLLWGDRVIIPQALQNAVLASIHAGHPGIVKMKALARSYVWWPDMDKDIEAWVATCQPCQLTRPRPPTAPIHPWETPAAPWSRLHIDLAGPCHGRNYLILVDAHSKWLEIKLMPSTTAEAIIKALRGLFATHGLPDAIASDNGPQFTAHQFEVFLADAGIRHILSAPGHPSTNGQAERAVRTAKEALSRLEGPDTQEKIDRVLLAQHTTPHATTNKSPAELLMGRRLRNILDRLHPLYNPTVPVDSHSRLRTFAVNDLVYARNLLGDPLWVPATITQVTGPLSYRVTTSSGKVWRRHVDQLRARRTRRASAAGLCDDQEEGDTNTAFRDEPRGGEPNSSLRERQTPTRKESQLLPSDDSTGDEQQDEAAQTAEERPAEFGGSSRPRQPSEAMAHLGPTAGDGNNSTASDRTRPLTELRRSARERTRPAYLRDYVNR